MLMAGIRAIVPPLEADRSPSDDIHGVAQAIASRAVVPVSMTME
jgi:hypothetical protein